MSNTKKGSKGPGYEYWSRRPAKSKTLSPSSENKRINRRIERAKGKQALKKEN